MGKPFEPGESRLMKVLVQMPDGSVEGHRAYPVAIQKSRVRLIVVAATGDTETYMGGRFYLAEERDPTQHPWVVGQVHEVPHESAWSLFELEVDRRAGHEDTL